MAVAGALRCTELPQLSLDDIEDRGTTLLVSVKDPISQANRSFCIFDDKDTSFNFFQLYRRYLSLRPVHIRHRRFFIYYKNGKCSTQVIGKNTLGKMPGKIAKYLNLPNPHLYTGHGLRRLSENVLAGCKFTKVIEGNNKSVHISKFPKLIAFMQRNSENYVSKKHKTLSGEQIKQFIEEAPDDTYLPAKVSLCGTVFKMEF